MAVEGYYRYPTISGERVVFVAEDDLWSVDAAGGVARRLTANPGTQTTPRFSPDGSTLAFVSRDEGRPDVWVMPADGGEARRLTFLGSTAMVVGWNRPGSEVLVASDRGQPFGGWLHLWRAPLDGGPVRPLRLGPAYAISFAPRGGGTVLARNAFDPARWKRYRGGRAGTLWIDRDGSGEFTELVSLDGNLASPMWIGRRIFFLSDHEGHGNLYSVTPSGRSLVRHTHHEDFYVRHPSTDGRRIVYHCGADLWIFDPRTDETHKVDVRIPSARPQRNRRFVEAGRFLETVDLHPEGHSLALTVRGGAYTMPLWEGAPLRHGPVSSHRQRLTTWLQDGSRIVSVTDETGEESLAVRAADGSGEVRFIRRDLGRVRSIDVAPAGPERIAVTNHRHELHLVNVTRGSARRIHHSPHHWIEGTAWSPDGRWLAFSAAVSRTTMNLFLYDTRTGRTHQIDRPRFRDVRPAFDPTGTYLYFLSGRSFDPVSDVYFHDFGFPRGVNPYLIPLRADTASPFDPGMREARAPGASPNGSGDGDDGPPEVTVDLEGLADRVVRIPVPDGRFARVLGGTGRILMLSFPVTGTLGAQVLGGDGPQGKVEAWDLHADKLETVAEGISDVTVTSDGKVMALRAGRRIRVVPSGWKNDKGGKDEPGRESGWVDLGRLRVEVRPPDEWRQMFTEAWRLQRDYFWTPDMAGVDWVGVHDRYLPLLDRVACRSEFSDLLWEMQGELGTSHAYELGGDYRPEPKWSLGFLGADLDYRDGRWRIVRIPRGDSWNPKASSPLAAPGVGAAPGDVVVAVEGTEPTRTLPPDALLVDRGGTEVNVTLRRGRRRPRTVVVRALASETDLRYRDWVERNREYVRDATGGRAGYLHIPDMVYRGFSEFHRAWEEEVDRDGLVVDVRFNRGGNVSQLLLEKLVRRRLGWRVTRWREPSPFPYDAPAGPMVCLTNEMAGSDGDIFSHTWKLHRLGPLIGTRTWGGVVGIWPQQSLVDGTLTTQPEFATWFTDVGFGVENYGTQPDIEVLVTPQDYREGRDPQLDRGIEELLAIIAEGAEPVPAFDDVPSVAPPRLR